MYIGATSGDYVNPNLNHPQTLFTNLTGIRAFTQELSLKHQQGVLFRICLGKVVVPIMNPKP